MHFHQLLILEFVVFWSSIYFFCFNKPSGIIRTIYHKYDSQELFTTLLFLHLHFNSLILHYCQCCITLFVLKTWTTVCRLSFIDIHLAIFGMNFLLRTLLLVDNSLRVHTRVDITIFACFCLFLICKVSNFNKVSCCYS